MYFVIIVLLCLYSAEDGFWNACGEFTRYLKNNPNKMAMFVYPLKFIMKFSPCASLKVTNTFKLYFYFFHLFEII